MARRDAHDAEMEKLLSDVADIGIVAAVEMKAAEDESKWPLGEPRGEVGNRHDARMSGIQ